jgi:hypothetical protein
MFFRFDNAGYPTFLSVYLLSLSTGLEYGMVSVCGPEVKDSNDLGDQLRCMVLTTKARLQRHFLRLRRI